MTMPADAPAVYAKSQRGPRVLHWIKRRGWLKGPRVIRLDEHPPEIETRLETLRKGGGAI